MIKDGTDLSGLRHDAKSSKPREPWQNGSKESLNGTFRREWLDVEHFRSVTEAQVVIEHWRTS